MYIKGIGLGFVLYAVFVFINTVAIVRGLTRAAGPNNGEVGSTDPIDVHVRLFVFG